MKQNTYLQTLLSCFSSMDIDKLRIILKDKYSYQDTTKEIFLNEIEAIFKAHKNSSDTELLILKGECGSNGCINCGIKGYRFVGNHSKNYTDLLFEKVGDEIIDICDCSEFKTEIVVDDLGSKASIYINLDDKVTFNKSSEYWDKVNFATSAYAEIISNPPQQLNFEGMCLWIDKHAFSNAIIGSYDAFDPQMKWTPFSILYSDLKKIKDYIDANLNDIRQANKVIPPISEEPSLIDWLLKYEEIYEQASFDIMYNLFKENDYYILDMPIPMQLKGDEFAQTLNFIESYQKHNEDILKKYSTYTIDEEIDLFNNQDYQNEKIDAFSLRFHIQNRKLLEELGFNIPFYLRG